MVGALRSTPQQKRTKHTQGGKCDQGAAGGSCYDEHTQQDSIHIRGIRFNLGKEVQDLIPPTFVTFLVFLNTDSTPRITIGAPLLSETMSRYIIN